MAEKILRTEYSEEMQKSYLDYSMSVITARAIPDARDGLKPVQRRVLYDMSELHLSHDKPHRKSARIVGDTMGKYHPHGDSSIYETLVVMSQPFKRGMPLVDGHGNFGSIEGDGAAAMRYTEAKLQKFAEEVYLRDLDKTVRFVSNYDETEKEPEVLPVRIPNLLVNGAEGIAVGMSTSIPPHNLGEVCDACIAYIKNPEIKYEKLLGLLKGPDFPTGGIVANKSELPLIYRTGVGKIKLRGRIEVELGQKRSDRDKLVITEIPYTMVGAGIDKFLMDVAALVESKKLPEVVDISNQSSKEGVRIVLELRRDADLDRVKNMLYKKTKLEDSFGVNMLAIADGRPETLDLKGILKHYLAFQYANAEKKYETLLEKERLKQEVQEGLIAACDCIDLIIAILRGAKKLEDAKACLTTGDASRIYFKDPSYLRDAMQLHFTERQAQAILEMRLYKLIGLEILALEKEHAETLKKIETYEGYLSSREKLDKLLIKDLEAIKKEYAHERRTRLEDSKEAVVEEKAPEDEQLIFLLDRFGYAKLLDIASYEKNREQIESEYRAVIPIMTSGRIQLYTSAGVLHQVKVRDIPAGKLKDKGVPIDNLSRFDGRKEEIHLVAAAGSLSKEQLLFVSREGYVKLVDGAEFETANKTVVATKLGDGDTVTAVAVLGKGKQEVLLLSGENYALRFYAEETPQMKKNARGVRGMRLGTGDYVQKALLLPPMEEFVFNGKKVNPEKIRRGHRDTKGEKLK
nr:DNA topoisomerase (ATP-hydrolyzing) [uncultured Stomatobaculum sp.]